jgi:tetratricopeptide (TPR) repeat protein
MSEAVYERYKDALRRGHVAAMHGRWDAALAAYVEAATIAPERALPHASMGSVYLRSGRPREALGAFDSALARSVHDEAALAGRASALEALARPVDAAATLDELATIQEADGRLADACDTARRALALAESRSRRRAVEEIVARLREAEAGGPRSDTLTRALQLLEATAVADQAPDETDGVATAEPGVAEPAPGPGPVPSLAELLELADRADAAAAAGDVAFARALYLELADGHARGGRPDAALDACGAAIAVGPAEAGPQLALAGLYLDRGWRGLGAEKLGLLDRLAALGGDEATRGEVRGLLERLALPGPPVDLQAEDAGAG